MFRSMSSAKNYFGKDAVVRCLEKHKVDTIFGYGGGAILPLFDSLTGSSISYYMNRHEQGSGHCAEGYAKATGKPGIVVSTSGPGVTNLITPLQDSYSDGVPLIVLTGQVPTTSIGSDAFQECPAIKLTEPCTKWNYQLTHSNEIEAIMEEAFHVALSGRPGPVHIDMPKDILMQPLDSFRHISDIAGLSDIVGLPDGSKESYTMDDVGIANLSKLIYNSEKPIIIAGQGCNNCSDALRLFAIHSNIPVTTTLHGMGAFDENHPLSLHMLGMHGAAYANYAIQDADLILSFGSRFDDRIIGNKDGYAPMARRAEKIGTGGIFQFEIDPDQVGKTIQPTKTFIGDCETFLNVLNKTTKYKNRAPWMSKLQGWKRDVPFQYSNGDHTIKTQHVIKTISDKVSNKVSNKVSDKMPNKNDVYITTGVGNHQMMAAQFYNWTHPKQLLTSGSLGTMGVGVPFAIGAQIAMPDKTIICIDGDGSFNMTLTELGTIAEYNIPVKIAIMNDSRQQMVYIWQKLFFDSNFISTTNKNPDYVQLAKSFGIHAIMCDHPDDLSDKIDEFLSYDGPIIANFIVEPDICLPLVPPGKNLDEMILTNPKDVQLTGIAPN